MGAGKLEDAKGGKEALYEYRYGPRLRVANEVPFSDGVQYRDMVWGRILPAVGTLHDFVRILQWFAT